jgi:hypothetical protein
MRYSLNCLSLPFSANYSSPGYFKCIEITFVPWSFKKYWLGSADEISLSDGGGATEEQISHIPLGWHHRYLTAENKPPTFAGPASLGGKRWKHWEKGSKSTKWPKWPSDQVQNKSNNLHILMQNMFRDAMDSDIQKMNLWCHGRVWCAVKKTMSDWAFQKYGSVDSSVSYHWPNTGLIFKKKLKSSDSTLWYTKIWKTQNF